MRGCKMQTIRTLMVTQVILTLLIACLVGSDLVEARGARIGANIGAPIILVLLLFQLIGMVVILVLSWRSTAQTRG